MGLLVILFGAQGNQLHHDSNIRYNTLREMAIHTVSAEGGLRFINLTGTVALQLSYTDQDVESHMIYRRKKVIPNTARPTYFHPSNKPH